MDRETFKQARTASGLSQEAFALAIGASRQTVAKIEGGKVAISNKVARTVADLQGAGVSNDPAPKVAPTAKARASKAKTNYPPPMSAAELAAMFDPRRLPQAYDFASAPAHTRGLERLPPDNSHLGAGPQTDTRAAGEGWQRVPGCNRIVSNKIAGPLPFAAPQWAGWRGVVTASGRVFDYETGHEMHQMGRARPEGRARLALQKGEKRAKG